MEGWNWAAVRNSLQKQNDEFKRIITVTPHTYIAQPANILFRRASKLSLSTPANVKDLSSTDTPLFAYSADRARPRPQKRCPAPQHGAKVGRPTCFQTSGVSSRSGTNGLTHDSEPSDGPLSWAPLLPSGRQLIIMQHLAFLGPKEDIAHDHGGPRGPFQGVLGSTEGP